MADRVTRLRAVAEAADQQERNRDWVPARTVIGTGSHQYIGNPGGRVRYVLRAPEWSDPGLLSRTMRTGPVVHLARRAPIRAPAAAALLAPWTISVSTVRVTDAAAYAADRETCIGVTSLGPV